MSTFYSRFHWREFVVGDVPTATRFFRELMGWTIETMPGSGDYQVASFDGHTLGGKVSVGPWEIPGLGHTAIICEPTGAYAQLVEVRAEIRGDPMHQQ